MTTRQGKQNREKGTLQKEKMMNVNTYASLMIKKNLVRKQKE